MGDFFTWVGKLFTIADPAWVRLCALLIISAAMVAVAYFVRKK